MIQYSIKVMASQYRDTNQKYNTRKNGFQLRDPNARVESSDDTIVGGTNRRLVRCNHLTQWKDYAMQCKAVTDGRAPSASAK